MARLPVEIVLDEEEEAELERWRRRRNTTAGLHVRAGIILDCARGYSGEEIAERHHTSQQTGIEVASSVCPRRSGWTI